jgi:uncharacterized protein (DUF58 family)
MISRQAAFLFFKRLGVKSRKLSQGLESGEYRSAFRGQGLEFKEVRPYQWGDDLRQIDWNVTARMGAPYVKELVEERELTHIVVLDKSASMQFGTRLKLKSDLALEIAWLLAFLALSHRDRLGICVYGGVNLSIFPPKKGEKGIVALLNKIENLPTGHSRLETALLFLSRILKRRSHIFLISDFFDPIPEKTLKPLSIRHEIFSFVVSDPAEWELPPVGPLLLKDQEGGDVLLVDARSAKIRSQYNEARKKFYKEREEIFRRLKIPVAYFSTHRQPSFDLVQFLRRLALK